MFRRPNRNETEEDILSEQKKFLENQEKPAAQVLSTKRSSENEGGFPPSKKITTEVEPEAGKAKVFTAVMKNVVERKSLIRTKDEDPWVRSNDGFPKAVHRDDEELLYLKDSTPEPGKKRSIFARQFAKCPEKFGVSCKKPLKPVSGTVVERIVERSPFVEPHSANSDMRSIHEENVRRLAEMTEEEILTEQQELLKQLDPAMVAFLKSRRSKESNERIISSETEISNQSFETKMEESGSNGKESPPIDPELKPWIHLGKIETEKLSWTRDLPAPEASNKKTGQPARFDFEGVLLASDVVLPVHLGLHHHGEEPERAGYTMKELFLLSRSTNLQQRSLAMSTLAKIITKSRAGSFPDSLSAGVLPSLLDGGLMLLIRWALDDSTETALAAAVNILHAVLVCSEDETVSDAVFSWYRGTEMPSLCPSVVKDADEETEDSKDKQETDADILKRDVILGLLNTTLLQRLCYILDVCRPSATVVVQIMEILVRIARHSSQAAYQIFICPRLLDVIAREFLPISWQPLESNQTLPNTNGFPLKESIKLFRVLSMAGRSMATSLLKKCSSIVRYIAEEPNQMFLPLDLGYGVCLESWRLWLVQVGYGLALDSFCDLFSIVLQRLMSLVHYSHVTTKPDLVLGSTMLGVVEAAIHAAGEISSHQKYADNKERKQNDFEGISQNAPAIPSFSWVQVDGLIPIITSCTQQCLREFTSSYFNTKYDLTFATSCLNCLATYYRRVVEKPGAIALEILQSVTPLLTDLLVPCLKSQAFGLSLQYLRSHSVYLFECKQASPEATSNLPRLGALVGSSADWCPVLHEHSTVAFLTALMRLLITLEKICHSDVTKIYDLVLEHTETLQYVYKICQLKSTTMASNWFIKFENCFQHCLITMARIRGDPDKDISVYHLLSLRLLTHLQSGDEHLAHDLLSTVVFNINFLRDLVDENSTQNALHSIAGLELNQPEHLTPATGEVIDRSSSDLIKDLRDHLPSIRSTYIDAAPVSSSNLIKSRSCSLHKCLSMDSLMVGGVGQTIVPIDWIFLPLVQLYQTTNELKSISSDRHPARLVLSVTNSLRAVYLLENWRPTILSNVSATMKLSRVMCTFLAGNDLFLDSAVHWYLAQLLRLFCRPACLERMDFEQSIPGLASFFDLYRQLVSQYVGVSFGDTLFSCYVLLPAQQRHSLELRALLWEENALAPRSVIIPLKELPLAVGRFLEPEESDLSLLQIYFAALFTGTVNPRRTPLPYLIAVHHVNRFFYTIDNQHRQTRFALIRQIMNAGNETLVKHLLYYKKANVDCEFGFELYEELPAIRRKTIETAENTSS